MEKYTFTVFNEDDSVFGYLFDVTRSEAQNIVEKINSDSGNYHYFMEGFFDELFY